MTAPIVPPTVPGADLINAATHSNVIAKVVEVAVPGASGIEAVGDSLAAVRRWISDRHNWVRVGWTVGGFALMYAGAIILARKQILAVDKATIGAGAKVAKVL